MQPLYIGMTQAFFNESGKIHLLIEILITDAIAGVIISPQYFRILGPIPSKPVDLLGLSLSIIFRTSNGVIGCNLNSIFRNCVSSLHFSSEKFSLTKLVFSL